MDYKLYYIEWTDALSFDAGWIDENEMMEWVKNEEWIVMQTGWLIEENEKYLVLATKICLQKNAKDMFSKFTKIPKTWIKKKKRVCKLNSVWPNFSFISNVTFFLKDSTLKSFFEQDQGSVKGGDDRSRLFTLDRFLSLSTFAFQS